MTLISKIGALIMSVICTIVPFINYGAENEEAILLNAAIISDIHIDARLPLGKLILETGLLDVKRNTTENDAVIFPGDLTNYGDLPSVEDFYEIVARVNPAKEWIIAPGNHDIGHAEDCTNEEARQRLIEINNRYTNEENENNI